MQTEHCNFKPVIEHSMICISGRISEDDSCKATKLQIEAIFWL